MFWDIGNTFIVISILFLILFRFQRKIFFPWKCQNFIPQGIIVNFSNKRYVLYNFTWISSICNVLLHTISCLRFNHPFRLLSSIFFIQFLNCIFFLKLAISWNYFLLVFCTIWLLYPVSIFPERVGMLFSSSSLLVSVSLYNPSKIDFFVILIYRSTICTSDKCHEILKKKEIR